MRTFCTFLAMYSLFVATSNRCGRRLFRSQYYGVAHAFSTSTTTRKPSFNRKSRLGVSSTSDIDDDPTRSPWNDPRLEERAQKGKNAFRARQHVNPLADKFQRPTQLSSEWPNDVFDDVSKPLFLDIGCSRGGFLVDIAKIRPDEYNYLGLEIRPIVAHHAKERIKKHKLEGRLDFVGCNANVDLERLMSTANAKGKLRMVTIQFPDPHFKARHAKRRVVTTKLVSALAEYMPEGATVFLQSDIQSVLDDMRLQFRLQEEYFTDDVPNIEEYLEENITGMPTEREVSVLEKCLPVYRTTFTRTSTIVAQRDP